MQGVTDYTFRKGQPPSSKKFRSFPLPISEKPEDFYDAKTDSQALSFRQLSKFIKQQTANGVAISGYLADLHAKISYPFIIFVVTFVVLPFALKPARSGSMAVSFIAGLIIGFAYYAVHSFSITMGRAELWPPIVAAWMANIIMGIVGIVLNLGAEAP